MKNEEIVNAAKEHERGIKLGKLAKSELSMGVNSAYGIGFLDGAEWALQQSQIIEIFGKRVKRIKDRNITSSGCFECVFHNICKHNIQGDSLCKDSNGYIGYHFVEVDKEVNEIKQ